MNGVHDMGGAHNFGPVVPEPDEPRFHHDWEKRVFALTLAMGATGRWTLDHSRAARESLPPARYLSSSYYEIWLEGLCVLMQERGLVSAEELGDGRSRGLPHEAPNVLRAERVAAALARGSSSARSVATTSQFQTGDAVRTRVVHPPTHTRLPRYCRGKAGTIVRVHGAHVFPDARACDRGEAPQWLYTVRFAASELWGPDTTAASVHVDCWEPYLEPAQ